MFSQFLKKYTWEKLSKLMIKRNHPFHIVFLSSWLLLARLRVMNILLGTVYWVDTKNIILINIGLLRVCAIKHQWCQDISRGRSLQGAHTDWVIPGLRLRILLFIASAVLLFFRFSRAFFHRSLAPNLEISHRWPPSGVLSLSFSQAPLLNTAVLLATGVTVT